MPNSETPIDSDSGELEWTGERFTPSLRGSIYYEHIHRYAFAAEFCGGKVCLDLASGEGFGANILARTARYVWGVDIDAKSITHATRKYKRENLSFKLGSAASIPLDDKSVDVVISFETIEHLLDHHKFMQEIVRVLKENGLLIISSPDKHEYTDQTGNSNKFHLAELYHADFKKLLETYFKNVILGRQRLSVGSVIAPDAGRQHSVCFGAFSGGIGGTSFAEGVPEGIYSIAVCSNLPIPTFNCGIFEDRQFLSGSEAVDNRANFGQVKAQLEKAETEKRFLSNALNSKKQEKAVIDNLLISMTEENAQLQGELTAARENIQHLHERQARLAASSALKLMRLIGFDENGGGYLDKLLDSVHRLRRNHRFPLDLRIIAASGLFDRDWYLNNYPDVAQARMDPLEHYVRYGAAERRDPNPHFSTARYLSEHKDIRYMNPFAHYLTNNRPRTAQDKTNPKHDPKERGLFSKLTNSKRNGVQPGVVTKPYLPAFMKGGGGSISVVMPTHNRKDLVVQTIREMAMRSMGLDIEFIVIDDGSTDATSEALQGLAKEYPNLIWRTVLPQGAGMARNVGVSLAKHDLIIFLGDDIQPLGEDFFQIHIDIHRKYPSPYLAVLGKVIWPHDYEMDFNFVMAHIQGRGGEQFGYSDLSPNTFVDWRFFYTSNVSIKRSLVEDWMRDGFHSQFKGCGFEDGEFAYRMSQRPGGFNIFYAPAASAQHFHRYTLSDFINRQAHAGAMAKTFLDLHPEVEEALGLKQLIAALQSSPRPELDKLTADYLSVVEGIKSWGRILEQKKSLGREGWHDELLFAIFELSYLEGFLRAKVESNSSFAAGYDYIIRRFIMCLRKTIHHEVVAHEFVQKRLAGFAFDY